MSEKPAKEYFPKPSVPSAPPQSNNFPRIGNSIGALQQVPTYGSPSVEPKQPKTFVYVPSADGTEAGASAAKEVPEPSEFGADDQAGDICADTNLKSGNNIAKKT